MTDERLHDAVLGVLGRETVRDVARLLEPAGIVVMPLKGVLFHETLYPDPTARRITDVDVLVPAAQHARAREVLVAGGYLDRGFGPSRAAVALRSPLGVGLDLHREIFGRARYRLSAADLFARGRLDRALFDVPVILPAPLDQYAHLVGKFAADRRRPDDEQALEDLVRLARVHTLLPDVTASHLEACGLGRAARYVLPFVVRARRDPFALAVLAELGTDRVGDALAAVARRLGPALRPRSALGGLLSHATNRSLGRSALSLGLAVVGRALGVRRPC